jgi:hypothetical protein
VQGTQYQYNYDYDYDYDYYTPNAHPKYNTTRSMHRVLSFFFLFLFSRDETDGEVDE